MENADELFDREEFSAAPDVGWPDCFNSGVFVYRPSNETYEKLVQFALEKGSFDGKYVYRAIAQKFPLEYFLNLNELKLLNAALNHINYCSDPN